MKWRRKRMLEALDEEIRAHIEREMQQNIERGMKPEQARRAAMLKFGNVALAREDTRAVWTILWLEELWQDVRYAARQLRRNPAFAFAAIVALAVGIGANAANFSIFDAIVWHAIPVRDFGRLVLINGWRKKTRSWTGVSYADYLDWQSHARSFEGLAALRYRQFDRTGEGPAGMVAAVAITPDFYQVLGARPFLGRSFSSGESRPGRGHVALLSYRYWQSEFAGDPHAVGRTIELDHAAYTIVGVMPRAIEYPHTDICVPLALSPAERADRSAHNLTVLGLLKPGVSMAQAQAELRTLAAGLAKSFPESNRGLSVLLRSLRVYINGNLSYYWGLMFAVALGLVLLIACANVTNLQLARGTSRRREIAVRASLGATRRRVVRQLMVESILTALLGAAGGLLLAVIWIHLAAAGMPRAVAQLISGWNRIRLSPLALAFTMSIAVAAGIVSGILPALYASKPDLIGTLKEGGRTQTPGRAHRWLQGALVVAQMAMALVLLVGTGLLVDGFQDMLARQKQFAPSSVLLFHVALPKARYNQSDERAAFYEQALQKLRAIPGARFVSAFTTFPMSNGGGVGRDFQVAGNNQRSLKSLPWADAQSISPGFFAMMHVPLVAGRDFTSADSAASLPVAIVSRNLARRYWPQGGAIGSQIRLVRSGKPGRWLTVVGVVGTVLWDWTDQTPENAIFRPLQQAPPSDSFFAIRSSAGPISLAPSVRQVVATIDPDLPVTGDMERHPETLRQAIHDSMGGIGLIAGFMSALGLIAFGLAATGVYSVMAYSVAERRHEIGVRMSLGASSASVLGLLLRRGARLLGIGLALGLPLAYGLARVLARLIVGVKATDPIAFGSAAVVLAAAALLASYVPARQAARVDPVQTLRFE